MNMSFRFLAVFLVVLALASGHFSLGEARCSCGAAFAQDTAASSSTQVSSSVAATPTIVPESAATPSASAPQAVQGPLPKLVDLGAGKCQACKAMAPVLEEAKKLFAGIADVEFIDVWENRDAGAKYGIRMIPTQIFFDASGKEVLRHEGFFPMEEIQKQFASMGAVLKKQ